MYVELHAASAFSFLEAASLPEILIERAAALGYPALALLDRDGLYGAPRFHQAARRAGLKAIVGAELTMRDGEDLAGADAARRPRVPAGPIRPPRLWRLPVLVESREGYRNLCRLITTMKLGAPKGEGALTLGDVEGRTAGLVALAGRAVVGSRGYGVGGLLDRLIGVFGRRQVYVELQRHLLRDQEADNQVLVTLASAFRVPVIATNGVRFATTVERPLFDVLSCIRHRTDLDRAGRRLATNAERSLKPPEVVSRLFKDLPGVVAATGELAGRLQFTLADLGYRFPEYPVPDGESMLSFLRKITEVGACERYRPYHARARAQIARELDLIAKLDLAGYFLIVWDLVNFCRQHGILAQGRGSAANSAVCYSLGITAVDPVGMDLLFERFLSEERGEWPDIDLDLPSGDRREQVIQYVYERYGRAGAAMTANVITYRGRSAAREVGKALGLESRQVDRLAKIMHHFEWRDPAETLGRHLREAGIDAASERVRLFADLWQRIQHVPRHLGQHSGGMVICQGRLDEVVPLENARMPGRVVVQWDKDDCADMGIVKVDLLGLGMMAALQDAITIVNGTLGAGRRSRDGRLGDDDPGVRPGVPVAADEPLLDLAHLPPDDPAVYRMFQTADTVGVFQVESRAQMATLPRLKPRTFYDLVVEVAIIRPGPIVGQMVHPYLARRAGREPVCYPHPSLEPILARTLGVPLFQEQLLRIAMVAAGFTGGEAEDLRRAFGFKRSEDRMRQIESRLREGMARRGIEGSAADEIVRAITSFALYGFPESHAASFALLVYASAYLKVHYPAAFYTALLNNQPMGFYHPATLVKDAQRRGVRFASIDVQVSDWLCRVQDDGAIRLGLMYVNGLRREAGLAIERAARLTPARSPAASPPPICPKCGSMDATLIEVEPTAAGERCFCSTCSHDWEEPAGRGGEGRSVPERGEGRPRFRSIEHLVATTGVRRDELAALAGLGALNTLSGTRRSALWQIERAVRPAGELFEDADGDEEGEGEAGDGDAWTATPGDASIRHRRTGSAAVPVGRGGNEAAPCPLPPMTPVERLIADVEGTGLTIGPHPMAFRRAELSMRGVVRAVDLPQSRHGRRVRVAGAVITRQRPGTAKGFVFLTIEDETGLANIIVKPDVFDAQRRAIVSEPFLLIEGALQIQDGVTSVRAERVQPLFTNLAPLPSHNFY